MAAHVGDDVALVAPLAWQRGRANERQYRTQEGRWQHHRKDRPATPLHTESALGKNGSGSTTGKQQRLTAQHVGEQLLVGGGAAAPQATASVFGSMRQHRKEGHQSLAACGSIVRKGIFVFSRVAAEAPGKAVCLSAAVQASLRLLHRRPHGRGNSCHACRCRASSQRPTPPTNGHDR